MLLSAAVQELILSITPKICASLSIPSSLFIIYEATGDHKIGRGTAIQRALAGMSVVDVLASSAWWLSTWAVPKHTQQDHDDGSISYSFSSAKGSVASCNYQGFMLQLAVGAPLYNCSLALYYMLVIKYNWTNAQLVKIERFVHFFIIIFAVGTSILGLPLTMYNRVGAVCWVIGEPAECGNSSVTLSDVPCERGDHAWAFGVFLFYVPLWLCVLLTIIAMFLIFLKVRDTLDKTKTYGFISDNNLRQSHMVPHGSNHDRSLQSLRSQFQSSINSTPQPCHVHFPQQQQQRLSFAQSVDSHHANDNHEGNKSNSNTNKGEFISDNNNFPNTNKQSGTNLRMAQANCEDEYKYEDDLADVDHHGIYEENEDEINEDDPTEIVRASMTSQDQLRFSMQQEQQQQQQNQEQRHEDQQEQSPRQKSNNSLKSLRGRFRSHRRGRSKVYMFATQATLYSLSFFITWTPSTVWSIAHWFNVSSFVLDFLSAFCEPLQGLWNLLIFIRRRPGSRKKLAMFFSFILPSFAFSFLSRCCCFCCGYTTMDSEHNNTRKNRNQRNNYNNNDNVKRDYRDSRRNIEKQAHESRDENKNRMEHKQERNENNASTLSSSEEQSLSEAVSQKNDNNNDFVPSRANVSDFHLEPSFVSSSEPSSGMDADA